jgi:hypothetical protein
MPFLKIETIAHGYVGMTHKVVFSGITKNVFALIEKPHFVTYP